MLPLHFGDIFWCQNQNFINIALKLSVLGIVICPLIAPNKT